MENKLIYGVDVLTGLKQIPDQTVHSVITSPPYWNLRDYGTPGQLGLEETPELYVEHMVEIFRAVRRVLRDDGTLWLNLGDTYSNYRPGAHNDNRPHSFGKKRDRDRQMPSDPAKRKKKINGVKEKDLVGIPWMVAFALRADGWYLRQDIIWSKTNPMPESVRDRCTKSHEYIFLMSKSERYFYDAKAIKENSIYKRPPAVPTGWDKGAGGHRTLVGRYRNPAPRGSFKGKTEAMAATGQNAFRAIVEKRNKRSVWTVATKPYKGAHFATFPPALIIPMVMAGCPAGGVVLDPFAGSGTTGEVAINLGRHFIGIDLNLEYLKLARERIGLFL